MATAPTPAFAHGTTAPTAKNFDCTAIPSSPVSGSNPTMENVATGSATGGGTGISAFRARRIIGTTIRRTPLRPR